MAPRGRMLSFSQRLCAKGEMGEMVKNPWISIFQSSNTDHGDRLGNWNCRISEYVVLKRPLSDVSSM